MADRFTNVVPDDSSLTDYFKQTDTQQYLANLLKSIREEIKIWEGFLDEISKSWRPDEAPDNMIDYLAFERGVPRFPDFISVSRRRKLLRNLVRLYQDKGLNDTLEDGIRIVTDLFAEVSAPWASDSVWTLGVDLLGSTTKLGIQYQPGLPDPFVLGKNKLGSTSRLDDGPTNQEDVYTLTVRLNFRPNENQLLGVLWIIELLKRAVDHYRIIYPSGTGSWIVGYSRTGIGTRVGSKCWVLGVSLLGVSTVICTPDPTPEPCFSVKQTLGDDTWLPQFAESPPGMWPIIPVLI